MTDEPDPVPEIGSGYGYKMLGFKTDAGNIYRTNWVVDGEWELKTLYTALRETDGIESVWLDYRERVMDNFDHE